MQEPSVGMAGAIRSTQSQSSRIIRHYNTLTRLVWAKTEIKKKHGLPRANGTSAHQLTALIKRSKENSYSYRSSSLVKRSNWPGGSSVRPFDDISLRNQSQVKIVRHWLAMKITIISYDGHTSWIELARSIWFQDGFIRRSWSTLIPSTCLSFFFLLFPQVHACYWEILSIGKHLDTVHSQSQTNETILPTQYRSAFYLRIRNFQS